jgi:hypothetical protein
MSDTRGSDTTLEGRIVAAHRDARRRRDATAASVLSATLGAIDNAHAVPSELAPPAEHGEVAGGVRGLGAAEVARRTLGDAEVRAVVEGEIAERLEAASTYAQLGRSDEADRLRAEAGLLEGLLRATPSRPGTPAD